MEGFSSLNDLYTRVKPALKCKVKSLKRVGIDYIKEIHIWNYLKQYRWTNRTNLALSDIVDDILNVPNIEIENYIKTLFKDAVMNFDDNK